MKIFRKLPHVYSKLEYQLGKISRTLSHSFPYNHRPQDKIAVSDSVINIFNFWRQFVRSFYISCCMNARTKSGNSVTTSQNSNLGENFFFGLAIQSFSSNKRPNGQGLWASRDEPPWNKPHTILKMAQTLSFSNEQKIQTALSHSTRVFDDIVPLRHFFCHRNRDTFYEAKRRIVPYGVLGKNIEEMVCQIPIGQNTSLINCWINDLLIVGDLMCD